MSKVKKVKKLGLDGIFGSDLKEAMNDIENFSGKKVTEANIAGVMEIDINKIKPNPYQPRRIFDKDNIKELSDSIIKYGLLSPVTVVKEGKGYILVAGERRLRAHKLFKSKKIKAIVASLDLDTMQELALIENIQREDLSGIEEAQACQALIVKHNLTQEDLAKKLSKSRTYITNLLRLLKLPKIVQQAILDKKLSVGHGKVLLSLEQQSDMIDFAKKAQKEKLSVRALESLVKKWRSKSLKKYKIKKSVNIEYAEKLIREKLNTKVSIKNKTIVISYISTSDLNRILEEMGALEK